MGVSRETLTIPTYTLCGITYKSFAEEILPPGHILGGIDVPADVSVDAHPLERERAQHPTHPHAAHGAESGHGLVENAAQRPRTIHAHEVLIERLGVAADRDASLTIRPQRRPQEGGQKACHARRIDGNHNNQNVVVDAQRAQARIDTGQRTTIRRILKRTHDPFRDAHARRHDGHASRAARLQQNPAHAVDQTHTTERQVGL